jgi:hypothetical protein
MKQPTATQPSSRYTGESQPVPLWPTLAAWSLPTIRPAFVPHVARSLPLFDGHEAAPNGAPQPTHITPDSAGAIPTTDLPGFGGQDPPHSPICNTM